MLKYILQSIFWLLVTFVVYPGGMCCLNGFSKGTTNMKSNFVSSHCYDVVMFLL